MFHEIFKLHESGVIQNRFGYITYMAYGGRATQDATGATANTEMLARTDLRRERITIETAVGARAARNV